MAILRFLPSCVGEKFLSRASFFAAVAIAIRFRDGSYRPAPQCMSGRGEEKSVGAGEGSCHRRYNRGGSAVCNKYRLDDISLTFSLLPPPPPPRPSTTPLLLPCLPPPTPPPPPPLFHNHANRTRRGVLGNDSEPTGSVSIVVP